MHMDPKVILLASEQQKAARLAALLAPYVDLTCVPNQSALEAILASDHYDALFYLRPPHSTGKRPLQQMRRLHPELPVIVLSDAGAVEECAEILEAGAFDLLVPPYEDQTLLAALEQAVASTQAQSWHPAGALAN